MNSDFHVVIPARYESSRLPGKPMLDIAGTLMIVRVVEQAIQSGAQSVVVATDDPRIESVVSTAGYQALITSSAHQSGSDRVSEVAAILGWKEDCVVVNVQGDEPLIPPRVISQVAQILTVNQNREAEPSATVATLFTSLQTQEELFDPNVVKVVTAISGAAMYFSRAPIPWAQSGFEDLEAKISSLEQWKRHIGIYAYTVGALQTFVALPVSRLELVESLEQLRMLDNGILIMTESACEQVPCGIDTPEDYERICIKLGGG